MLGVQGTGHGRTAHQLVMSGDTLELVPACRYLILRNGRFGHFEREVVFGHAVERTAFHTGRHFAFADDGAYAETVVESTALYVLYAFREHQPLQTPAFGKCI